ncbi:hypothetical protein RF11_08309 [Thelohanellus kitauei]|uniref:Uncharacterized protein n=1 Tax=Thelohanellus kitauei TaxID=669202 RepID=A0A0C2NLR5_THEKT|nr:hypothetical protein RF11_08309 [Thelohanellus kitauei]
MFDAILNVYIENMYTEFEARDIIPLQKKLDECYMSFRACVINSLDMGVINTSKAVVSFRVSMTQKTCHYPNTRRDTIMPQGFGKARPLQHTPYISRSLDYQNQ